MAVVEESAGGVLDIEPEDESAGALGEVDCCLEQATMATALRQSKRRLRFIRSPHCVSGVKPPRLRFSAGQGVQRSVASGVPPQHSKEGGYFLAAIRFFFLAGSFGRDLPNEPW